MQMHEVVQSLEELYEKMLMMQGLLSIEQKIQQISDLTKQSSEPGFWDKQETATKISKQLGELQQEVLGYQKLKQTVGDLLEMAKMDEADKDVNLREELETQLETVKKQVLDLEFYTLMSGKHDGENAIVSVHAGSGGTEAQDWAEMLLRMIMRYCEKKNWRTTILDESRGSEAGIKSTVFRVEGRHVYGHLKSEHGTHRLVRISPFDAEKMRHTSFALIEVIPEIEYSDFELDEKDLRMDTFMAGGHGGQSVNTTYSAVRLVHIPTGITVQCQNERSQLQNRETALKILKSKLQTIKEEEEEAEMLKIRGEHKSAEWGNQIRSYVLHPYKMVKDLRTRYESNDPDSVLNGELDEFIAEYLKWNKEGRPDRKAGE